MAFTQNKMILQKKHSGLILYLALVLIAFWVSFHTQLPSLFCKYSINDDAMQHTYWMVRFHDQALFANDIFADYNSYLSPPGFKSLYYLLTFVLNPLDAGKLLSIALYIIAGIYLYKIGESFGGRLTGIAVFLSFICFPQHLENFAGGLQRSFGFPLLAAFIYYLCRQDLKKCVFLLILESLFYPVVFLLSYLTLILFFPFNFALTKKTLNKGRLLFYFLLPILIFLALLAFKALTKPGFLGPLVSKQEMLSSAAFYLNGRSPYLPLLPLVPMIRSIAGFYGYSPALVALFCSLSVISLLFYIIKKPDGNKPVFFAAAVCLLLAGIVLYQLACFFIFKLFIPSRYIEYTVPLLYSFVAAIALDLIFTLVKKNVFKYAVLAVFIAFSFAVYKDSLLKKNVGAYTFEEDNADLYGYLAGLPKDALIGANPFFSDRISTFAARKVFTKRELSHPWFKKYAAKMKQRILDFYKAYYSASGRKIYGFCKKNGIAYLIVKRPDFSPEYLSNGRFYHNPLNEEIRKRVSNDGPFFLPNISKDKILFETKNGQVFVIKADKDTLSD